MIMEKTFNKSNKEYIAPEMEVVEIELISNVLDSSGHDWGQEEL